MVGEPSWTLGSRVLIDGRTRFAKKFTVVVKTQDLFSSVLRDWSAFTPNADLELVYDAVEEYVQKMFCEVSASQIQETKSNALREHVNEIRDLSSSARLEVSEFVEELTEQQPTIQADFLSVAVGALINLQQSHSGSALLSKLSELSEEDIEGLDQLLNDWTIRDALTVLDAIDRRLATLEAINKLSGDEKTDELHTLHPLVTQARWLFGPEFESAEYASNISLRNAVNKVFDKKVQTTDFINSRKRPDLIILANATLSAVALDQFDHDAKLTSLQEVLLIELKRGASRIGRDEVFQATSYIQDLLSCGILDGSPFIHAFVVGDEVNSKVEPIQTIGSPERGRVIATTYSQLVRTGEARLFRLRDQLQERYGDIKGTDLLAQVMAEPTEQFLPL